MKKQMNADHLLLGVHCSVAGGLQNAFNEADELGIDCIQIFTKNQRQWKEKEITPEESEVFKQRWKESDVRVAFSHSIYLLNLASGKENLRKLSIEGLIGEVRRCDALGLAFTVLHPGSAKDLGFEEGIKTVAEGLKTVLNETKGTKPMILLENTAGQGSAIGYQFEHLREIMDLVASDRIGVCFDTCHAFAAGYDIRTKTAFDDTMAQFDKIIGLKHLKAIHLNDSKGELGSRLDRHEHIGHGNIGAQAFGYVMKTFANLPKVLETPKTDDWDRKNLDALRKLYAQKD